MAVRTNSAQKAEREAGAAVPKVGSPVCGWPAADFTSGGCEFQTLEVLAHRFAKTLAAGDGGPAGHHQDEIPARRTADLADVAHVHQTRAADAQHRLRL